VSHSKRLFRVLEPPLKGAVSGIDSYRFRNTPANQKEGENSQIESVLGHDEVHICESVFEANQQIFNRPEKGR
jgi:hypothetical protein